MKKWLFCGLMFLPFRLHADPLASQFIPTQDTKLSDYYTSFGTITLTNDMYKVFQSSALNPTNPKWLTVYSMRNEIRSFQAHISPSTNITSLSVSMSNLVDSQTTPSSIIYSTSTNIVVYREWYLDVATPTCTSTTTFYGGARAYMPFALIPSTEPYYNQYTNAFPVAVTSGNVQSAWFDVHIPTSAPSGYYTASVYVSSGNVVVSTMPVTFAVWNWIIPSSASLPMIGSGFGYNGFNNVAYGQTVSPCPYPNSGNSCDTANIYEWIDGTVQMLDNKWGIDTPNYIYPGAGSFSTYVSNIGPLINGTTADISTVLPGAALGIVDLNDTGKNSSIWQNWASTFTNQGWFPRLFNYACDEPAGSEWTSCVSGMSATRSYSTPLVPNQVTADMADSITNGATDYIDWMTPLLNNVEGPTISNTRSTYTTWLSTVGPYNVTRRLGTYMACGVTGTCSQGVIGPSNNPAYPNYAVDGVPVANRAFQTYAFVNNFGYELYYAVDECDNTSANYPCYGTGPDPWHTAYSFGGNGEGTLMLPSTTTITTTSNGTPIWCPTVVLKMHRDGMNDYEYENYLTKLGYGTFVNSQIASWYTNDYTFNTNPTAIEAARIAMGNEIHQLSLSANNGTNTWSGPTKFQGKIILTP